MSNTLGQILLGCVVALTGVVTPLLINRQLNRQRKEQAREKVEDRKREDAVRVEAKRQQDEVAREKALQDKQAADAIENAARLLLERDTITRADTKEVAAQLVAGETSDQPYGIPVVISYLETSQREEIMLATVPRIGERIRLRNGPMAPSVIVVDVVHNEAFLPPPTPSVIVVVRAATSLDTRDSDKPLQQRKE